MNRSETIKELATALCKFQSVMENVTKDSSNPFFHSKYADLASCWDAIKKPLTDNGLSIVQPMGGDDRGDFVETILMHTSGEWISGRLYLKKAVKDDMQTLGSAVTYARRYGLSAIVGLCPEDDDGNSASGNSHKDMNKPAYQAVKAQAQKQDPKIVEKTMTNQFFTLCQMAVKIGKTPSDVSEYIRSLGYDTKADEPMSGADYQTCGDYFSRGKQ